METRDHKIRVPISYFLLPIFCLLSGVGGAIAQNHPELNWRVIQTEHFNIFYHQGEEGVAGLAAEIAEEIYGPITSLYRFQPDGKVHIVIKDCDDYSQGLAYYYDDKIEIWATSLDFELRGTHDWLWNVITHEFTHIVSLQVAMKGPRWLPGLYLQCFNYQEEKREDVLTGYPNLIASYPIPGTTVPMWFAEGVAQYQADGARFDHWDSHRDMLLRMATLGGKLLSYQEMGVFEKNGLGNELVYNQGYSLVRFISERFGADKLEAVLKQMSRWWRFNFNLAIERVLGISDEDLYYQWRESLEGRYAQQTESVKENLVEGEPLSSQGYSNAYPVWSPDGEKIAYLSNKGQDYHITSLYVLSVKDGTNSQVAGGAISSPSWVPDCQASGRSDGERLLFAKKGRPDKYGSGFWDIYECDIKGNNEIRLTYGLRVKSPDCSPDGKQICFVKNQGGTSNLGVMGASGDSIRYLTNFNDRTQIYTPRWSPDGQKITFSISRGESRDIAIINSDGEDFRYIVSSEGSDRDPCWIPDGKGIIFSSDVTGIFNLYSISLEDGQIYQLTDVLSGAFWPAVSPKDGRIAFSLYTSDGYQIRLLPKTSGWRRISPEVFHQPVELLSHVGKESHHAGRSENYRLTNVASGDVVRISKPYRSTFLGFSVMPRIALDEGRLKPGFYMSSSDVLDKQSILTGLLLGTNLDLDLFAIFEYKEFIPTFSLGYYKVMRHLREDKVDPDNILKIDGTDFDLNEVDLEASYKLWDKHLFSVSVSYSQYSTKVKGVSFSDRVRFTFPYTYFKGWDIGFSYYYQSLNRLRDQQINPSGREVSFRYDWMYNYLIEGFKPSALIEEIYDKFYYNRLSLDWREYLALPWDRHTLGLRLKAGLIDRKVDDFLDFHLGGLPGMRGYTYWSLEGRKVLMANITYRFPILKSIKQSLFHLYFDKLYAAVYADVGRAWDSDAINFKATGFKRDVGAQLRLDLVSYYTFPTRIEIDAAYGLDEVKGKSLLKLYFTVLFGYI